MLYSGYVNSNIFDTPTNVLVRCPNLTDWRKDITSLIQITSTHEYLIIIDSLNGMTTAFGHKHLTLHSIMLMSSLGAMNTRVVVAALTKKPTLEWKIPGSHTSLMNTTYVLEMVDDLMKLSKVV